MRQCAFNGCTNTFREVRNRQFCNIHTKNVIKPLVIKKCEHPGCQNTFRCVSFRKYCKIHQSETFGRKRWLATYNRTLRKPKSKTKCHFCEHMMGLKKYGGYCSEKCRRVHANYLVHKTKKSELVYVAQSNYGYDHPYPTQKFNHIG